jgi:hypothetical protein
MGFSILETEDFLPLGVLWRKGLDPVEDEDRLEVHRLLGPETIVVVEGGDDEG